jgi:predicted small secreted protein
MIKKIVLILAALSVISLNACNTMQGAGRDVEKAGQKVEKEAQEHKTY